VQTNATSTYAHVADVPSLTYLAEAAGSCGFMWLSHSEEVNLEELIASRSLSRVSTMTRDLIERTWATAETAFTAPLPQSDYLSSTSSFSSTGSKSDRSIQYVAGSGQGVGLLLGRAVTARMQEGFILLGSKCGEVRKISSRRAFWAQFDQSCFPP
jgi:hypothetical protein